MNDESIQVLATTTCFLLVILYLFTFSMSAWQYLPMFLTFCASLCVFRQGKWVKEIIVKSRTILSIPLSAPGFCLFSGCESGMHVCFVIKFCSSHCVHRKQTNICLLALHRSLSLFTLSSSSLFLECGLSSLLSELNTCFWCGCLLAAHCTACLVVLLAEHHRGFSFSVCLLVSSNHFQFFRNLVYSMSAHPWKKETEIHHALTPTRDLHVWWYIRTRGKLLCKYVWE